jgi:hypothetical protein
VPAFFSIRLRDDQNDLSARSAQSVQYLDGEFSAAEKNDLHQGFFM